MKAAGTTGAALATLWITAAAWAGTGDGHQVRVLNESSPGYVRDGTSGTAARFQGTGTGAGGGAGMSGGSSGGAAPAGTRSSSGAPAGSSSGGAPPVTRTAPTRSGSDGGRGGLDPRAYLAELRARRGGTDDGAREARARRLHTPAPARMAPPVIRGARGTSVTFGPGKALAYARDNSYLAVKFERERAAARRALQAAGAHPALSAFVENRREIGRWDTTKDDAIWGLNQPLDLFGNRSAAKGVARRDVRRAELAVKGFAQRLEFEVLVAYRDLQYREARLALADFSVRIATKFLRVAELRRTAGTSPEIDVIRGEAELYRAEAEKQAAAGALAGARAELARVMGYPDWRRLEVQGDLPRVRVRMGLEELERLAFENRVDLEGLEVDAERLEAERRQLAQRRKPILSTAAQIKDEQGQGAEEFLGLRLDVTPLWYGKVDRLRGARRLQREAVLHERLHHVREMRITLSELLRRADLLDQRLTILQDQEIPKNALQLATVERGYRAGGLDNLAVLNAQRTSVDAVGRYLDALGEAQQVMLQLRRASGMAALKTEQVPGSEDVRRWIYEGKI